MGTNHPSERALYRACDTGPVPSFPRSPTSQGADLCTRSGLASPCSIQISLDTPILHSCVRHGSARLPDTPTSSSPTANGTREFDCLNLTLASGSSAVSAPPVSGLNTPTHTSKVLAAH